MKKRTQLEGSHAGEIVALVLGVCELKKVLKSYFGTLPAMEKRPKLKKKCKYRYFEKALIARAWKTLQKVVSWTDFLAKNVYILITVFLTGNIVKTL